MPDLPINPALAVSCPDCYAQPGQSCRNSVPALAGTTHVERRRIADLRQLTHGTCALCGQPMVYGTVLDQPPTAWHPDLDHAAACPPIPDPTVDPRGWYATQEQGLTPGHPGIQHFRPDPGTPLADAMEHLRHMDHNEVAVAVDPAQSPTALVCPECAAGKCPNCTGDAWDPDADDLGVCTCTHGDQP